MKRFAATTLVLALVALGAFAASASACSCPWKPDAERFAAAEAAFVGTLVDRHVIDRYRSVHVYRVDEVHKGAFGETVEIETATDGGTCGLPPQTGTQSAIYPRRFEGGWRAGSCDEGSVAGMRAAARPPARPRTRTQRLRSRWTALCLRALAWQRP